MRYPPELSVYVALSDASNTYRVLDIYFRQYHWMIMNTEEV